MNSLPLVKIKTKAVNDIEINIHNMDLYTGTTFPDGQLEIIMMNFHRGGDGGDVFKKFLLWGRCGYFLELYICTYEKKKKTDLDALFVYKKIGIY